MNKRSVKIEWSDEDRTYIASVCEKDYYLFRTHGHTLLQAMLMCHEALELFESCEREDNE